MTAKKPPPRTTRKAPPAPAKPARQAKPARSGRQPQQPPAHHRSAHAHHPRHGHGHGKHGLALPGTGSFPACASSAVAVSLLLATGKRASERDILALHEAAGGDGDGVSLLSVLSAARTRGLAGWRAGAVRLVPPGDGVIASLSLTLAQAEQACWEAQDAPGWGLHAAVLADSHALTWGQKIPVGAGFLARHLLGCWAIDWARW